MHQAAKTDLLLAYRLFYPEDFNAMSSYGSAHSGQLHPGYPPQQRTRSHSNPPYPITPGTVPYPQQQQSSYFPAPPPAPYQQAPPTSTPIAIPASNRQRASSDYGYGYGQGYGTSPSHPPPSSPYAHSYPTQHLQPIPQQQPIPEDYQYPPHQHPSTLPTSPAVGYQHRRRSSSSHHAHDPRQSYESAHSYQSAHSPPSPDYYARHAQSGHGWYGYGGEAEGKPQPQAHEPPKGYGDWDKEEVSRYHRNQDLERRPTLGGSLMSLVKRFGGSERR